MKEKVIELAKELDKLYYPGIYVFLNKKENVFYVGKASVRIFDRVKADMLATHKKTLEEFIRNKDTGLYIFNIDSDDNYEIDFDEQLLIVEYGIYVYMTDEGYTSINNISGFAHKTREFYNVNRSKICVENFLEFDKDLFWNGFKEVIFDRRYINDLNNKNRRLEFDLECSKDEHYKLKKKLIKYQNKESETLSRLLNKISELENEMNIISKSYKSIKTEFINLGKNIYFIESEFNEILDEVNKID